jgi:hypothetical protein
MSKRGRAKKAGNRTAGGRLSRVQAPDRGSDRVQAARATYAPFQDGKAYQQVHDPIGRAWAVGLLENGVVDPAVLRDAGREYGDGYWAYYPSPKAVASYAGRSARTVSGADRDPQGEYFDKLDELLSGAGRAARDAVTALVVDHLYFPDDNPAWLQRLINERLIQVKRPAVGQLPAPGDHELMRLAIAGLVALTGRRG